MQARRWMAQRARLSEHRLPFAALSGVRRMALTWASFLTHPPAHAKTCALPKLTHLPSRVFSPAHPSIAWRAQRSHFPFSSLAGVTSKIIREPAPDRRLARRLGYRTCRKAAVRPADGEHCSKLRSRKAGERSKLHSRASLRLSAVEPEGVSRQAVVALTGSHRPLLFVPGHLPEHPLVT